MILVCNITLPCDQREVWVDVGYWNIFCASDGSWGIILSECGLFLGGWDIILDGCGCVGVYEALFGAGRSEWGKWDIILVRWG